MITGCLRRRGGARAHHQSLMSRARRLCECLPAAEIETLTRLLPPRSVWETLFRYCCCLCRSRRLRRCCCCSVAAAAAVSEIIIYFVRCCTSLLCLQLSGIACGRREREKCFLRAGHDPNCSPYRVPNICICAAACTRSCFPSILHSIHPTAAPRPIPPSSFMPLIVSGAAKAAGAINSTTEVYRVLL